MPKKTTAKTLAEKQKKAYAEVCKMYWDIFKDAELKHDHISAKLTGYSSGENYISFQCKELNSDWSSISNYGEYIQFTAKEFSEEIFDKAIEFIKKEIKNRTIRTEEVIATRMKELKEEIERKQKKLLEYEERSSAK